MLRRPAPARPSAGSRTLVPLTASVTRSLPPSLLPAIAAAPLAIALAAAAAFAFVLGLAGCAPAGANGVDRAADAPWRRPLAERAGAPFPRAVRGDLAIASPPQRVVAGSVTSAEVLLELLPAERFAGVIFLAADPEFCAVAPRVAGLPHVGQDPESLVALRPDLVVIGPFTNADTQALLAAAGVPVVRTGEVASFADVADDARLLGWITGRDREAEELVAHTERRLASLAASGTDAAAWRVMNLNGSLETYGKDNLFDAVVRAAGARNEAADRDVGGFRKVDVETVLAWRPDALLLAVSPPAPGERDPALVEREVLRQTPGFELLPCVQRERFVYLPRALLGSTSHHAVEAAARLQSQLREWGRP